MAENGREIVQKMAGKKAGKRRNKAPISILHTAHFARKMVEKLYLIREKINETKNGAFETKSTLWPTNERRVWKKVWF
jgi:hypothetical protein